MERVTVIVSLVGAAASVIAAVASVVTYNFSKRMSRGSIRRKIAAKERQIQDIQNQIYRRYGLNDNGTCRAMTSLDKKKKKLQKEIEDLRLEL